MEKCINGFEKGINQDVHPTNISKSEYWEAKNVVLNNKSGNLYSLSNEEGFTLLPDFSTKSPNRIPIGVCCLNDEIIVFSVSTINDSSEIGLLDQQGNYFVVLNDGDPQYWENGLIIQEQKLNFLLDKHINSTARIGFNNHKIVYWVDDVNYPRFLDLTIDHKVEKFKNISDQTKLQDNYKYPHVEFTSVVEGGQLKCGVYQFAARYLNTTLDPTGFGYTSNIIPITNENKSVGPNSYDGEQFDAAPVSKSIKIEVSNIDTNYDFIEIAAIYYSGSSSQFKANIFTRQSITGSTMDFTFDGTLKADVILPEDLQVSPNIYSSASQIIQKDGILFLGNLKKKSTLDLQNIANNITIGYEIEEQLSGFKYWGDTSTYSAYKEEYNTFKKKTFLRGEVYSLALVGKTITGEETFAYHIPAKFPDDYLDLVDSDGVVYKHYTQTPNQLGIYTSGVKYNKENYYKDTFGNDLADTSIRHHLMPALDFEPTYITDPLTKHTTIRLINLVIKDLEDVLNLYPKIKDQLESLSLVVEQRDAFSKKSIYSQGFVNNLLKQDGQLKKMVRAGGFQNKYFSGDTGNAITSSDEDLNEDEAKPVIGDNIESYIINPFFGNTHIHDYNSAVFMQGRIAYQGMRNGGPVSWGIPFDEDHGYGNVLDCGVSTGPLDFCGTHAYDRATYGGLPVVTGKEISRYMWTNKVTISPLPPPFGTNLWDHWEKRPTWEGALPYPGDVGDQIVHYSQNWTGQSEDSIARSTGAFYSAEAIFLKDNFNIPVGAYLVPIIEVTTIPERVLPSLQIKIGAGGDKNTGKADSSMILEPYDLHLGSYAGFIQYPFSLKMRSPFFHLLGTFREYNTILNPTDSWALRNNINASKITVWNDVVRGNEEILGLKTFVQNSNRRLNNYDNEGFVMLEFGNSLVLPPSMQFITCVLGGTKEYDLEKDANALWNYEFGWDHESKYINNRLDDETPYVMGHVGNRNSFITWRAGGMNEIFMGSPTIYTYDDEDSNIDYPYPDQNAGVAPFPTYTTNTVGFLTHWHQTIHRSENISELTGADSVYPITTQVDANPFQYYTPEYRLEHRLGASIATTGTLYGSTNIGDHDPLEETNRAFTILNESTNPNQTRYLYNIQTDNKTQYGELDSNEYIRCETFYNQEITDECNKPYIRSFNSNYLNQIYGGDTFINELSYKNSLRMYYKFAWKDPKKSTIYNTTGANMENTMFGGFTRITQNEGAELRALNTTFVESQINCDYRHREVDRDERGFPTSPGVPYYPKSTAVEALDPESEFGQSDGYNVQYSKSNDTKKFVLQPFGYQDITDFPTRIIYSLQTLEGEQSDNYRQFKPNNFQDLPKNKGELTNLFVLNQTMFANTERSLWRLFVNDKEIIVTSTQEAILGTGAVLSAPPQEIFDIKGGYCGTIHDRSCVNTPFGYVWVDHYQRKIFLFNGSEAPEEISQIGLYDFFQKNINALDNNIQNPNGEGVISMWEPNNKRIIISIRTIPTSYNTLSFSFFTKQWISLHDYSPDLSVTIDDKLFSFKNGNFFLNEEFKYGVFYSLSGKEFNESYITTVINDKPLSDKVFDSIECLSECYDRSNLKPHLRFFDKLELWNDYQYSGEVPLVVQDLSKKTANIYLQNVKWLNRQFQISTPLSATIDNYKPLFDPTNVNQKAKNRARLRGKYLFQKFRFINDDRDLRFVLLFIANNYRISIR